MEEQLNNLDVRSKFEKLRHAVEHGDAPAVAHWINVGADVNHLFILDGNFGDNIMGQSRRKTVLDFAVTSPTVDLVIVRMLLNAGADVDNGQHYTESPLRKVIRDRKHPGLAIYLLKQGAQPNNMWPAAGVQCSLMQDLLFGPAFFQVHKSRGVVRKVRGVIRVAKALIDHGAKLTDQQPLAGFASTPDALSLAVVSSALRAERGNGEILSYMLETMNFQNDIIPEHILLLPLYASHAQYDKNLDFVGINEYHEDTAEIVGVLLDHGADANPPGGAPICVAAKHASKVEVALLAENRASPADASVHPTTHTWQALPKNISHWKKPINTGLSPLLEALVNWDMDTLTYLITGPPGLCFPQPGEYRYYFFRRLMARNDPPASMTSEHWMHLNSYESGAYTRDSESDSDSD